MRCGRWLFIVLFAVVVTGWARGAPQAEPTRKAEIDRLRWEGMSTAIQGRIRDGVAMLEQALELASAEYGPDAPGELMPITSLAGLHATLGALDRAEALYRRGLSIVAATGETGSKQHAELLAGLADARAGRGDATGAMALHAEAYDIERSLYRRATLGLALAALDTAGLRDASGETTEAAAARNRALALVSEFALGDPWGALLELTPLPEAGLGEALAPILGPGAEHMPPRDRLSILAAVRPLVDFGPALLPVLRSLPGAVAASIAAGDAEDALRDLAMLENALSSARVYSLNAIVSILLDRATVAAGIGRFPEAEGFARQALDIVESGMAATPPRIGGLFGANNKNLALTTLGNLLTTLGRYDEAEQALRGTLGLTRHLYGPQHVVMVTPYNNLGLLHEKQGRYEEAKDALNAALAIAETEYPADSPPIALVINNLALIHDSQSLHADAEALYRRALAIRERALGPDHLDVATSLNNLALSLSRQGRFQEALEEHHRALAIRRAGVSGPHPDIAQSLGNIATLLDETGRHGEALPLAQEALEIFATVFGEVHPEVATATNNLAHYLEATGRNSEALPLHRRALRMRRDLLGGDHPDVGSSLNNLAYLVDAEGQPGAALEYRRQATAIMQRRHLGDDGRGANAARRTLQGQLAHHLQLLWRVDPGRVDEALKVVQSVHVSAAGASLARMASRFATGTDRLARAVRERQETALHLRRLEAEIITAAASERGDTVSNALASLRQEERQARDRLDARDDVLRAEFPDYAALANPLPVGLAALQQLLRPNEALLAFAAGRTESYWVVVTAASADLVRVDVDHASLARAVTMLRNGLDPTQWEATEALPAFPARAAFTLYQKLWAPLEPALAGMQHVIVVPDGALASLPLGVLLTRAPAEDSIADLPRYRAAPWLARDHAITVLPTVGSLRSLRTLARRSAAPKPFLGVGDPLLRGHPRARNDRSAAADPVETATLVWEPMDQRGLSYGSLFRGDLADVEAVRDLAALPETARELSALAASFGAPSEALKLREAATETALKGSDLSDYRVLAFATHGLLAGELQGAAEPALVMTPPVAATEDDDGLLTASEIAQLELDADWVILSACNTAGPSGEAGAEGLSGLARAFFFAGARALFVSHWPVFSVPAVTLTTRMVEALQAEPALGPARAHQRAMLSMLDDQALPDAYAHPAVWAPFVVVGAGGATAR